MPISEAAAEALVMALLAGGDEAALEPLRGEVGRRITWVAVNEARIDATIVSESGREWRIVLGTSHGTAVDWLAVHERPDVYTGTPGGLAVVVNGPSGAGKSQLMAALSRASPTPFVVFDEPTYGEVEPGLLIWRERAVVLHRGFLAGIGALAREGNLVTVAAAGWPQAWFRDAFGEVPTLFVGLHCAVETLLDRERGREGRAGGLARASHDIHDGWTYDLELDTDSIPSYDLALRVLAAVGRHNAPG